MKLPLQRAPLSIALTTAVVAQIHVLSHVVHYGSSVFEGVRCYETKQGPATFRLRDHMRRLVNSGRIYYMDNPYSVDQLCDAAAGNRSDSIQYLISVDGTYTP